MSDYLKFKQVIRELSRPKICRDPRLTDAKIFKTRILLESIFRDHKINRFELQEIWNGAERESSETVIKWLRGHHTIFKQTKDRLEEKLQTEFEIFNHPVFDLLEKNISRTKLNKFISQYTEDIGSAKCWNFKSLSKFKPKRELKEVDYRDSDGLFQYGGINGFTGILILLRKAELDGDSYSHYIRICDAYRAFPGFCRNKYFKKRWKCALKLLTSIHENMQTSSMLVDADVNVILRQIRAKHHPTIRHHRPISPIDRRFIELDLPYLEAKLPNQEESKETRLYIPKCR